MLMQTQKHLDPAFARTHRLVSSAVITIAVVAIFLPSTTFGTKGPDHWYHVTLAKGKTSGGYQWAVGAKGRKGSMLDEICATLSMTEPPQDDIPYVEGTDSTDCGSVRRPAESIASSVSMGQGESEVKIVEWLYRPAVRKVNVVFKTGEERVLQSKSPGIARRAKRGIPKFRFLVLPLEDGNCVRRVVSYDAQGGVINREKPEGSCR
jgi:hypothetical protein